jgi:hypothetical protein
MYKYFCLVIISFLILPIPALASGPFRLNYSHSQFTFYSERGFDRIKASDFHFTLPPGAPELPVKYLHFIIPPDKEVEFINYLNRASFQNLGSYYLYPSQPNVPICSTPHWVPPDTLIYNSDSLYPGKITEVVSNGVFDGARIVTVAIYPLQYRPLTHRLFILTDILFDFQFRSIPLPRMALQRTFSGQKVYDDFIRATVYNDEDIPIYYRKPIIIPDGGFKPVDQGGIAPFTIITSLELFEYFLPLREWLREKGWYTTITTTDWIYNHYPGRDNAEQIRNFLTSSDQISCLVWVLLGGDDGVIPVRYGCYRDNPYSQWSSDVIPSDLYFSDLSGDWNVDNDEWWGEPFDDAVDVFPEVFVGRVTVKTGREIEIWTEKILHYEKYASDDLNYLTRAFWGYSDISPNNPMDPYSTRAPQEFHIPPFIHCMRYHPDADEALDSLNRGFGYDHFYCHGGPDRIMLRRDPYPWSTLLNYVETEPTWALAGLNWLTNNNRYYPLYSIGCYQAAYDNFEYHGHGNSTDTTIADAFVDTYRERVTQSYPIGSSAFLGNTRNGIWYTSGFLHKEYCEALFEEDLTSLGTAEGKSKVDLPYDPLLYHYYLWHSHNLFGSPETEPWFKIPGTMVVTHPQTIPCGVPVLFEVSVKDATDPAYISNCRVCLYKPDDVFEVGYTDINGTVLFEVCANELGELKVTCVYPRHSDSPSGTYNDYLPSQTICVVEPSDKLGISQNSLMKFSLNLASSTPIIKSIRLKYVIPTSDKASINLYNSSGLKVATLLDQWHNPGYYDFNWKIPANLPSGTYWLLLETEKEKKTLKLLLIR